jgi:hypothetical protein
VLLAIATVRAALLPQLASNATPTTSSRQAHAPDALTTAIFAPQLPPVLSVTLASSDKLSTAFRTATSSVLNQVSLQS